MKKASPQTGRVEVTSLHGFIYENAAHSLSGWNLQFIIFFFDLL